MSGASRSRFMLGGLVTEDTHVIDEHRGRENGVRSWIAVEVTANREIENHDERFAEHRLAVRVNVGGSDLVVRHAVDEPLYAALIPLHGVGVKVSDAAAGKSLPVGERRLS